MEVETVVQGAGALSTFGLYTLVAALAVVVVYLFRRLNHLEREFRESLVSQTEKTTHSAEEVKAMAIQMQEVIKANTEAFKDVSNALRGQNEYHRKI